MIKNLQIKTCVIEMSKMKKLGIIGIGNWGKNLIRDASKISYVKKCSSQGNPKNINWLKKNHPSIQHTTDSKEIFTDKEIQYCNSHTKSYIHFSGKYAVKEAVKKALLSNKIIESISMKEIEVLNNPDKSPYITLNNLNDIKCNVSISHDGDYAIAFIILEK